MPSPKSYYCLNDQCGFYKTNRKKGKSDKASRWQIVRKALLTEDSYMEMYCPQCKWVLRVNMDEKPKETNKIDTPVKSALDLLKSIPNAE